MKRKYQRIGFTAAQSAEVWERWKKGEGLKSIGRILSKPSFRIFNHIKPSGGIMPPARRRSRLALILAERQELSRGLDKLTVHGGKLLVAKLERNWSPEQIAGWLAACNAKGPPNHECGFDPRKTRFNTRPGCAWSLWRSALQNRRTAISSLWSNDLHAM